MLEKYVLRPIARCLMRVLYRVEVRGMENYHKVKGSCVIVCNHQSFLDPLIIGIFLPEHVAWAINVFQADKWYFRWLDKCVKLYKLDPSRPMVMKSLMKDLADGGKVALFPEGRITTSGGIMKVYEGTNKIIEKTGATILPIRIDGAEYSKFSRVGHKLRQCWFPKVTLTVMPPCEPHDADIDIKDPALMYDMMCESAFGASNYRRNLLSAILESSQREGLKHVIASDISRVDMTYGSMFTRGFILSNALRKHLTGQRYVGVLLPNSLAVTVTFIGLHMLGKVPCMLNFSSGSANIVHGCNIADVKTVLTSHQFVEKGGMESVIEALSKAGYSIVYLEDVRQTISLMDKLKAVLQMRLRHSQLQHVLAQTKPDDPAVILYTSGSEGKPKGVALSHANLLANIYQTCSRLSLMPSDKVFNALPVFHSFGLSIGLVLPLVRGVRTFLYPSPVHYRMIPELIYDTDATIMLGTDTFYRGYAHYAHPYDFWNIRLAVAGAEKLKDSTRQLYMENFDLTIYEGYGVTETSPVASVNTPIQYKHGSVGKFVPGMQYKLEPVEGLAEGGRLYLKGPNVMLGYLNPESAGEIQRHDGWYDTGDIITIDEQGFITIQGRAKRFAKIGGEMVSLMTVENIVSALYPEQAHAAIAVADEQKGERIILFSEQKSLTRDQLIAYIRANGIAELCLPKTIEYCEEIPRLGNGKVDYMTLQKM